MFVTIQILNRLLFLAVIETIKAKGVLQMKNLGIFSYYCVNLKPGLFFNKEQLSKLCCDDILEHCLGVDKKCFDLLLKSIFKKMENR